LINAITIEYGNIVPLLLKIKKWQSLGCKISIFANSYLKKRIDSSDIISGYNFIELKHAGKITGKLQFILEALRRNIIALFYIKRLKKENFDVVYSISSVMDLIIFPWVFKKTNKKTKWLTVFDNVVPLNDPGNKIVRFLGWLFFKTSIFFLKKADHIFAISEELKEFLEKKGMDKKNITVTGNAVEIELIRKARKDENHIFDTLFVGRINETKGIYDMLDVLKVVMEKYPHFQLGIVGEGDATTKSKFKDKIKEMHLDDNIKFLGYKTGQEKFNIIKSAKCFWFLSFSKHESFGISLLEAVCSGIPAFCYDLGPLRDIYKNEEVIMSPKRDWRLVAQKVIALFDGNNFENKKGELLLDRYGWDDIAEKEAMHF